MADWGQEAWIKIFTRDTATWSCLSWQARGLYVLLQRAADRDARIDLGRAGVRAVAALVRAPHADIEGPLSELVEYGYVVVVDDTLELPEHRDQQASRATAAARQREFKAKTAVTRSNADKREVTRSNADKREVTRSNADKREVTRSNDKNRIDENRIEEQQSARTREAAPAAAPSDRDPTSLAIEAELRASPRFASLDHASVADALLGSLGSLGTRVTAGHARDAVAAAALELEDGARERRQRQVLGWKLRDAVDPTRAKKPQHQVQAVENLDRFMENIKAGRPTWA